jgi:hypothetical protein
MRGFICCCALVCVPLDASAQIVTHRGFVEARATVLPLDAPNDHVNAVGDVLARGEVFVKPAGWIQFAAGLDARANTHDQVRRSWRLDFTDRTILRPAWSIRRLSATLQYRSLTVDAGKQVIRWGKTDIVTPTDHFAPRDFLNVLEADFLAVAGVRGSVQLGSETIDLVVVPRLTPSRMPLLAQRWAPIPPGAETLRLVDSGADLPEGTQTGVRWSHVSAPFELSLSYFDGFNHLPDIEVHVPFVPGELVLTRVYPAVAAYGADAAVPTRWFTIKGESAYFTSSAPGTDEYVLYVLQLERLLGEWVLIGGYAGEMVTERNAPLTFAPNRGLTRSFIGRASYTIDVNRTASIEGALRQNGDGAYVRVEYSQARGQHWRATAAGAIITGSANDFLGQYRRNSHISAALRYSF